MEETPRTIINDDPNTWDIAWRKNITPWDKDKPQPALREVVESGAVELPRGEFKTALVPGCGSGNDVAYFAATLGITTVGVDVSAKAVEVANERLAASDATTRALVQFQAADFFSLTGQYDLVYDYTFFVAIPPKRRAEWAAQMSQLVRRGGLLMTLVYPIAEADKGWGPPWFLRPEHYDEVLKSEEWEKVCDEAPKASEGDHIGRERMVIWRRV